jgi:tetraacyldisaccharide 4'-kinase
MKDNTILSATYFREVVSGRQSGLPAAAVRSLLRVAEVPYTWAVARRNLRYDRGHAEVHRAGVPVVSIGNLTLGGTGKTPMVEWIARWFLENNMRVGLISRGYGSKNGAVNDEARELAWKLPGVPHVQNPDRVKAAQTAIEQFGCQVLVLDDAFQHRRIHRDLDIVLVDALEPTGLGHVFPRGTLREPLAGLARADMIVLSRADMIDAEAREAIRRQLQRYAPHAAWLEASHAPQAYVVRTNETASEIELESLADQPVLAFCGIGNPAGFRHTLESCGCRVAEFMVFPDHHPYNRDDLSKITATAHNFEASAIVCTQKDLVKLNTDRIGKLSLWALRVGLKISVGQEELEERLRKLWDALRANK